MNSQNIMYNGHIMDSLTLEKNITDRIKRDKKTNFILSMDSCLTYQEYIKLIDQIQSVYGRLRSEFLIEKYGTSDKEKLNHLQIDSAISRYPMRIIEKHYLN